MAGSPAWHLGGRHSSGMTQPQAASVPDLLLREFASVVGEVHVLTGDATAGYAGDWTSGFAGHAPAVLRPGGTAR